MREYDEIKKQFLTWWDKETAPDIFSIRYWLISQYIYIYIYILYFLKLFVDTLNPQQYIGIGLHQGLALSSCLI